MSTNLAPETRAAIAKMLARGLAPLRAEPRVPLSVWAEERFKLDADSSQQAGHWVSWPFQRALMDWMSDDRIVRVIVRKSKRVGYTKILTALLCYAVHHLRRNAALWQPTDDDRDSFVRTELDPVIQSIRYLRDSRRAGGKADTLKLKQFQAAVLHLLGGKAARAFRRITVQLAILDEWSAFDQSVEGRGDPGSLAFGRLEGAAYPKFIGGSTPGTQGACHVSLACAEADVEMHYHVECPHCGVEHPLSTGRDRKTRGKRTKHGLQWEPGKPETVHHICPHCLKPMTRAQYLAGEASKPGTWVCVRTGTRYEHDRTWRNARGQEIRPPRNVAACIWSAYSPQKPWTEIAEEDEKAMRADAAGDASLLITLINEVYGEAYEVQGAASDEHHLAKRAAKHPIAIVPRGALVLTSGIDVQADRVEIGVWGWAKGMESWAVDHCIIEGNPSADDVLWDNVATYLQRRYPQAWGSGLSLGIEATSIDSGYATHAVYNFVRAHPELNLRAVKGMDDPKKPIKSPATSQDVTWRGKRWPNGVKLWPIGTQASEDLLHGQLAIETVGPGFVHFAEELNTEWYAQLTGKKRIPVRSGTAIIDRWTRTRPRIEVRDCRRYAHHAALCLGLDAYSAERWRALEARVQPPIDLFSTVTDVCTPAEPVAPPVPPPAARMPPPKNSAAGLRAGFNRW
jgi:phage terminase large subunit GpA-like protein